MPSRRNNAAACASVWSSASSCPFTWRFCSPPFRTLRKQLVGSVAGKDKDKGQGEDEGEDEGDEDEGHEDEGNEDEGHEDEGNEDEGNEDEGNEDEGNEGEGNEDEGATDELLCKDPVPAARSVQPCSLNKLFIR